MKWWRMCLQNTKRVKKHHFESLSILSRIFPKLQKSLLLKLTFFHCILEEFLKTPVNFVRPSSSRSNWFMYICPLHTFLYHLQNLSTCTPFTMCTFTVCSLLSRRYFERVPFLGYIFQKKVLFNTTLNTSWTSWNSIKDAMPWVT